MPANGRNRGDENVVVLRPYVTAVANTINIRIVLFLTYNENTQTKSLYIKNSRIRLSGAPKSKLYIVLPTIREIYDPLLGRMNVFYTIVLPSRMFWNSKLSTSDRASRKLTIDSQ